MPAIEVRSLGKSFGKRRACWDLTFEVERGEVFGLLGPNGAGKTTTLRMLAGLYAPDQGGGTVAGLDLVTGGAALRRRVGLLTESPGFYDRLSARENLLFFAQLYGVARGDAAARASRLLDRFALAPHAQRPFAELSRGMKQKLAIARALLHEPEVIFLDEPTVGLDPEATREVRTLIEELAREQRTLVLCTHHLAEVERVCGRAAFVAGRLIGVHRIDRARQGSVRIELAAPHPGATARAAALGSLRVEGRVLHLAPREGVEVPEVVAALVAAGARVAAVGPEHDPLEDAYLALLAEARTLGLLAEGDP